MLTIFKIPCECNRVAAGQGQARSGHAGNAKAASHGFHSPGYGTTQTGYGTTSVGCRVGMLRGAGDSLNGK